MNALFDDMYDFEPSPINSQIEEEEEKVPNNKKRKIGEISNTLPNQDLTNESDQNNYDDFKSDLPEQP